MVAVANSDTQPSVHRDGAHKGTGAPLELTKVMLAPTMWLAPSEGTGNDRSGELTGLSDAAPERAPVFAAIERAIGDGSSASVSYTRLQAGSPHRTQVDVAIAEAARPSRPDRDRAGTAPCQRVQALAPLAQH